MAKLTFNVDMCKGCGLCVAACPKHILEVSKVKINKKGQGAVQGASSRSTVSAPVFQNQGGFSNEICIE